MTETTLRKRRKLAALIVAALAVVALALVLIPARLSSSTHAPEVSPTTRSDTPSPSQAAATSGSHSPSPKASGSGAPASDPEVLSTRVQQALDRVSQVLSMRPDSPTLEDVATGAFLTTIELQRQEWEDSGWHQEGAPTVESIKILREGKGGSVVVTVCVDSSKVRVLDENGVDMRGPGSPNRSLNVFTLSPAGGEWVVADQTFSGDPKC